MILVYDTETTGLPDFKARSDDPVQPHLVQIALCLYGDDGTPLASECMIVRPAGWVISADMTKIHGISHERAMDEGVPEDDAVERFIAMQGRGRVRVAHNESFDRRIMRIAMTRAGMERDFIESIEARSAFCTCTQSTKLVNLPPTEKMLAKGMKTPKPPSLTECLRFFLAEDFQGAHRALADAEGCARVYFHLQTLIGAAA